jgi:hypothetical protein
MGELNIAPNTQIGKIEIPQKVYEDENAYGIEESKYSRGGEFTENLVTDNILDYGGRWFKLGSIREIIDDIDELLYKNTNIKFSDTVNTYYRGYIPGVIPTTNKPHSPIRHTNEKAVVPFTIYTNRDPKYNYMELKGLK